MTRDMEGDGRGQQTEIGFVDGTESGKDARV